MPTLEQLKAKRALLVVTLQRTDGAIALLDEMIAETQQAPEPPVAVYGGIDRSPSPYWQNGSKATEAQKRNHALWLEKAGVRAPLAPDAPPLAPEMLPVTYDKELDA